MRFFEDLKAICRSRLEKHRAWYLPWGLILTVAALSLLLFRINSIYSNLIYKLTLQDISLYSYAIQEFRTMYTREVVEVVRSKGIQVTHDYKNHPHAIPLPATFSLELGEHLSQGDEGLKVKLYSPYPFPWRKESGGLKDQFAKDAWAFLRSNPNKKFSRIETHAGEKQLRLATGDIMRPACIACHNNHPDTPKSGWETGDLRGILEISRPLGNSLRTSQNEVLAVCIIITALLLTIGILAISTVRAIYRNVSLLKNANESLEKKVAERSAMAEKRAKELEGKNAEFKKAQTQLIHSEKMNAIGQLTGGIAHEFNNILTGILGLAYLMKEEIAPATETAKDLEEIIQSGGRGADLVKQMLAFSRELPTHVVPFDIGECVHGFRRILSAAIGEKIELKIFLPETPLIIFGDSAKIKQILLNLCINGRDAIEKSGTITIRMHAETIRNARALATGDLLPGEYVRVGVKDSGAGMPAEIRQKIFDPFYTTKPQGQGTGLGLSVVHGIMAEHKGGIEIQSELGKGTEFALYFKANKCWKKTQAENDLP